MNKQTAVEKAAAELLAHGGPTFRTDTEVPMTSLRKALAAGATSDDIAAEMRRQRGQQTT